MLKTNMKIIGNIPVYLKILLLVLVALLACLILNLAWLRHRNNELKTSVNNLQEALSAQSIDVTKTEGCGRPYTEFGRGDTECSISLSGVVDAPTQQAANSSLVSFAKVIDTLHIFEAVTPLPHTVVDKDNLHHGWGVFRESNSGRLCTAAFEFDEDANHLTLSFTCNTTTWFDKLF